MKRLLATTLLAAAVALPAAAADPKQELTINRGSNSADIAGLVVQGNSIVLVYGQPGMSETSQGVRIMPDGNRLRVTYDTVSNLGVNTAGLRPMMMLMLGASGSGFPIYNMGSQGAN
jgi:opacity protein-like surface antigen